MKNMLVLMDNQDMRVKGAIIETERIDVISIIKESLTRLYEGFPVNWELAVERESSDRYAFIISDTLTNLMRATGHFLTQPNVQTL